MSAGEVLCLVVLALWNIVTFGVYGVDKQRARKNKWRVSEGTLFLLAILGGSIGAYLAMYVFHHKTNKKRFRLGIPLIFILQLGVAMFVWLT